MALWTIGKASMPPTQRTFHRLIRELGVREAIGRPGIDLRSRR